LTIKEEIKEKKVEVVEGTVIEPDAEIIEEDGKQYVMRTINTKKVALKTYKDGVLLGLSVYRNKYRPVYMKKKDRTRHHYVIGKSGTGKSVYISMLARQDIWAGA
jgi:DNA helicase HerA-like ATPase